MPPAITFDKISRSFGSYTAVDGIDLEIDAGKFVSVVGPSGCGKSTLLNLAAGLIAPSMGQVSIFGEPLKGLNHRAAYMFQQDALLPWKTVLENVGLGLRFRGTFSESKAQQWVERVGLAAFADKFPSQLSGGMRKRVAMAQCWIVDPDILLMDEPFSALDIHTRMRMEGELLDLWTGSPKTVLFVTHDLEEALSLSDEVVVLSAGPASRIIARHIIDLPRPRNLMDIRTDPRFAELYRQIWAQLKQEVLTSYAR
ncbi:MAG TPA: ABC transporter ATP-binding protein [Bryobacteraceae bacterium]|nr:ABC transporter ATP-binding protein [Bryobacteraceae bacterium]